MKYTKKYEKIRDYSKIYENSNSELSDADIRTADGVAYFARIF